MAGVKRVLALQRDEDLTQHVFPRREDPEEVRAGRHAPLGAIRRFLRDAPLDGHELRVHVDHELQNLLAQGKAQGYLTYEQVSAYLPDETCGTDRIDTLLAAYVR